MVGKESKERSIKKAVYDGYITLGDRKIEVVVLEDGTRLLSQTQTLAALGRKQTGGERGDIKKRPVVVRANNLFPYLPEGLRQQGNVIEYQKRSGKRIYYGMKYEVLPMVCETYLNAKQAGALRENQERIAAQCLQLQNAFAKVGLAALIDEATGYQDIRAAGALASILSKFFVPQHLPYVQRYPIDFYREMYRLKGWSWIELAGGRKPKTPAIVGRLTVQIIHKRLGPGLRQYLNTVNRRKQVRDHQWFSKEVGIPHLERRMAAVIALMQACEIWDEFQSKLDKVFPIHEDVDERLITAIAHPSNKEEDEH